VDGPLTGEPVVSILDGSSFVILEDLVVDSTGYPGAGIALHGSGSSIAILDSTFVVDDDAGAGYADAGDVALAFRERALPGYGHPPGSIATDVLVGGNTFTPAGGTHHRAMEFGNVDGLEIVDNPAIGSAVVFGVGGDRVDSSGVLIEGNTFPVSAIAGDSGVGLLFERDGSGELSNVLISDNDFQGRHRGILFYAPSSKDPDSLKKSNLDRYSIGMHNNRFEGNTIALEVGRKLKALDATYNWWDDASGPQYKKNPDGLGEIVEGKAYVVPFATNPAVMLQPDFAGEFVSSSLRGHIVPGDKATVKVRVTNLGDADARGRMTVAVYLSVDGVVDDGDMLLGTKTIKLKPLRVDRTKTYSVRVTIPWDADAPPGVYNIVAIVDANGNFDDPNAANDMVADPEAHEMHWEFGEIAQRENVKLVIYDEFGEKVSLRLRGDGTGQVVSDPGDPIDIVVVDTDYRSDISIYPRSRHTGTLHDMTVWDEIDSLYAPRIELSGDLVLLDDNGRADLTLKETLPDSSIWVEGTLYRFRIRDDFVGTLVVENGDDRDWGIRSAYIGDDLGSTTPGVATTWDIIGGIEYLTVDDTMRHTNLSASWDIWSLWTDKMIDSAVFAGVDPDAWVDNNGDGVWDMIEDEDDFDADAIIFNLTVSDTDSGDDFVNSNIAATELHDIFLRDVDTHNGGDDFGVSALEDEIWNLRVRQGHRTYYWDYSLWWDGGEWWPDFDHDDFTVLELD